MIIHLHNQVSFWSAPELALKTPGEQPSIEKDKGKVENVAE